MSQHRMLGTLVFVAFFGCVAREPDLAPELGRFDLFPGDRIARTTTISLATLLDPPAEAPADCAALETAIHSPDRQPENQTEPYRAEVTAGYLTASLVIQYSSDVDEAMAAEEFESLEPTLFLVTQPEVEPSVGLTCVDEWGTHQSGDPYLNLPGGEQSAGMITWGNIARTWAEGLAPGSYDVGVTLRTATRTDTTLAYEEHPLWTIIVTE